MDIDTTSRSGRDMRMAAEPFEEFLHQAEADLGCGRSKNWAPRFEDKWYEVQEADKMGCLSA